MTPTWRCVSASSCHSSSTRRPPQIHALSRPQEAHGVRPARSVGAPVGEERVRADKEGVGPLSHERCVGSIDVLTGTGIVKLSLQPEDASSRFKVAARGLRPPNVGRIDKYGEPRGSGHQLKQSPSRFAITSAVKKLIPVALPPGRARLATRPSLTGSSGNTKAIGMSRSQLLPRALRGATGNAIK